MRLKFYKRSVAYATQLQRRSTEKFVSRFIPKPFYSGIDPEVKRKRIFQGLGRIPRRLSLTLHSYSDEARRGVSLLL